VWVPWCEKTYPMVTKGKRMERPASGGPETLSLTRQRDKAGGRSGIVDQAALTYATAKGRKKKNSKGGGILGRELTNDLQGRRVKKGCKGGGQEMVPTGSAVRFQEGKVISKKKTGLGKTRQTVSKKGRGGSAKAKRKRQNIKGEGGAPLRGKRSLGSGKDV